MKSKLFTMTLTGAALLCGAMTAAYAYDGGQYAKDANLTLEQARAQALKLAPGTIKDGELERESGGSGLRYSFDIKTARGLREVGIDAASGAVLENSAESAQAEATEARAEHEARGVQYDHEGEHENGTVREAGAQED